MRTAIILAAVAAVLMLDVGARADTVSAAAVLAQNRLAMGDPTSSGALRTVYAYAGQGLSGFASRTSDLTTGNFVESYVAGPISGGGGFDGKTPWMRDISGANTPEQGGDRITLAVNAAYRYANLWWRPDFGGAHVHYAGSDTSGGGRADHLVVTPKGGTRFDAWFDVDTHRLTYISEEQEFFLTRIFYAQYARRNGQLLPLLATIDRGVGKANYDTLRLRDASVIPALPQSAYALPAGSPTGARIVGGTSTTLPFRLLNNHIYICGKVDGKGPFTFMVDTGGHTLLSPRLLAQLGGTSAGKAATSGVGPKIASLGFAKVGTIALGGVRMRDQTAFITNVYAAAIEGIPVDGMVGFELFRRFVVRIDYGRRTITFFDPKRYDAKFAGTAVPFKFYDHLPDVEGDIAGIPAHFDIDTGSRSELDVTSPFVTRKGLDVAYPRGVHAITGYGVGGAVNSYVVRIPSLRLGNVTVREPVAELSNASGGSFSDAHYDGNIGSALLKRFVVTFDYARRRMYLKRIVPAPADVGTFDRSGLWLNAEPGGYLVVSVDEGSPAAQAGLGAGDVITAIDGKPARMESLSDVRESLRTLPVGRTVRCYVSRRAARKTVSFTLRDQI
jgi:hypothetical protein